MVSTGWRGEESTTSRKEGSFEEERVEMEDWEVEDWEGGKVTMVGGRAKEEEIIKKG